MNEPRSARFRREREAEWAELDALVERSLVSGLGSLEPTELHRLPMLYRAAISSLSVARKTAMDRALVAYLEGLVMRAYLVVYGSRRPERSPVARFFLVEFPRRIRAMGRELGLSTLLFSLGVSVAFGLVMLDPDWYYAFVSQDLAGGRVPGASRDFLRSVLYDGDGGEGLAIFASFLFTHNAGIGLLAFALGFAAGVPTALLVFGNGLMLGAFLALYARVGLLPNLLGWLLPHGVPELGAVILCGAAGFHLGRALLFPGALRVRDALAAAGRRSATVIAGCVFLFLVAGLVEGVFRQVVKNDALRFALAGFNLSWFLAWLFLAGRTTDGKTAPEAASARDGGKP